MKFLKYQAKVIAYCAKLYSDGFIAIHEFNYQHNKLVVADCSNTINTIENELFNSEFI